MKVKWRLIKPLFTLALAGLIFGCTLSGWDTGIENGNSGIEGQVLRGPIHGGPVQVGEVSEEGFAALFYVNNNEGKLITTFHSNTGGHFRVVLQAGTYEIVPDKSAPLMNAAQQVQQVTVEKDRFTNVTLHFDTGLR